MEMNFRNETSLRNEKWNIFRNELGNGNGNENQFRNENHFRNEPRNENSTSTPTTTSTNITPLQPPQPQPQIQQLPYKNHNKYHHRWSDTQSILIVNHTNTHT